MKNKIRRLETFSFFNHTGIREHLEKMAKKGWMIEKLENFGWVYRRIEPKNIHFAVSYYPKASEFDPEPTEEQKIFHEFCEHTGWKLACTSAQIQIFYNEQESPIPIETEPELELEAIHASAKRGFLPPYFLLLFIALLNCAMFVSSLLGDPISLLARPSNLFSGFAFLILVLLCAMELISYFSWMAKAKKAAGYGEFLSAPDTSKFQKGILIAIFIGFFYWVITFIVCGDSLQRWVGIMMFIYIPILIFLVNRMKQFLKHKKVSRGINRTITILTSFVGSFLLMGIITFIVMKGILGGMFAEEQEETYEHRGTTLVIHQDELPLVLEDLIDIDYDGYIKERRGDISLFLGDLYMDQHPRLDADNYEEIPQLSYRIVLVKFPGLYDLCKERLIYEQEKLKAISEMKYKSEDAKAWGANEVYRLYDFEYGARNTYLLCFDKQIVEIHFDWEPTVEQMAIVGEKLNN